MVIIWHRGKAKAVRLLGNARTVHKKSRGFPYEIVEMIIAHLVRDLCTLKACSLTCRPWYTAAVPHIHHTLVLKGKSLGTARGGLKSLSKLHKPSLIPLVEEIWVLQGWPLWFKPQVFGRRDLHLFSALANVHTLRFQELEIYRFIPGIERYFGQFSPTLRSIALFEPRCIPRQLSYFLSLFSTLDDIEISGGYTPQFQRTLPDPELVPFFTPKLRGRLTLNSFDWVKSWTYLTTSYGCLRFRYMDLYGAESCGPILLKACAETLETLRLSLTDGPG